MVPLLEIKTVPIEIQVKTQSASLEYTRGTAEMEISRSKQGSPEVKSRPIKVQQDTFEPRGLAYRPAMASVAGGVSAAPAAGSLSAASGQGVYEVTSAYADEGQISLNVRMGHSMPQQSAAMAAAQNDAEYVMPDLTPKSAVNVEWEDGSMEIRYNMDKLNFDWKFEQAQFKFTPGDIEFTVATRPSVTFTYTGGPIYVPRSADPNYQPVNVEA